MYTCVCVHVYVCVPAEVRRSVRPLRARVAGNCELLLVDMESQTQLLWESSKHPELLSDFSHASFEYVK